MAYGDDITTLGADHLWRLSADSTDSIGASNGVDTGMAYTGAVIAKDGSNSAQMNARGDRISIPTISTINNAAHARKAVCGWFMVDDVELPSCRIYGEGNQTTYFQFVLFPGNSVMLEARDSGNWQVQVYSDISLEAGRAYHLCGVLEGNGYGNGLHFYIDGVEQFAAIPTDRAPNNASLASRGVAEFGDPAGTVGVNGVTLLMQGPGDNRTTEQVINAHYQHWAAWGDKPEAILTLGDVRETLFERGALGAVVISTDTLVNMQADLDTYADTLRGNAPCCIEIEPVSGGGDFTLDLDNITFNSLASIHVLYTGTVDTLTMRNTNGAAASIGAAPFGGSLQIVTEVTVQVTAQDAGDFSVISGARVLIETDTDGPAAAGVEIISTTTNGSGVASVTYDYAGDQPVIGKARKGTVSPLYKTAPVSGSILATGLDQIILMVPDE